MDHPTAMLQHSAAGSHRLADPNCRNIRCKQHPIKQRGSSYPASPGLQHPLQGLVAPALLHGCNLLCRCLLLGRLQQPGILSQISLHIKGCSEQAAESSGPSEQDMLR